MGKFLKDRPQRSEPSQAEMRRAKDFYADVFVEAIIKQIEEDSAGRGAKFAGDIVDFASDVAQKALEEMEKRWPKI